MIHRVKELQLSSPSVLDGMDPSVRGDVADRLFGRRATSR